VQQEEEEEVLDEGRRRRRRPRPEREREPPRRRRRGEEVLHSDRVRRSYLSRARRLRLRLRLRLRPRRPFGACRTEETKQVFLSSLCGNRLWRFKTWEKRWKKAGSAWKEEILTFQRAPSVAGKRPPLFFVREANFRIFNARHFFLKASGMNFLRRTKLKCRFKVTKIPHFSEEAIKICQSSFFLSQKPHFC